MPLSAALRLAAWRKAALALLACGLLLAAPCARALTVCGVSSTGLLFANYSLSAGLLKVNGTITVTCTAATGPLAKVNYVIALGVSQKSGTMARNMVSSLPAGNLLYNLYTDNGYGTVWGDTSAGTATISGNVTPVSIGVPIIATHTIFGAVPAAQNATASLLYTDTVTATLTY